MTVMEILLTGAVLALLVMNYLLGKWLSQTVDYYKDLSQDYQDALSGWGAALERAEVLLRRLEDHRQN